MRSGTSFYVFFLYFRSITHIEQSREKKRLLCFSLFEKNQKTAICRIQYLFYCIFRISPVHTANIYWLGLAPLPSFSEVWHFSQTWTLSTSYTCLQKKIIIIDDVFWTLDPFGIGFNCSIWSDGHDTFPVSSSVLKCTNVLSFHYQTSLWNQLC